MKVKFVSPAYRLLAFLMMVMLSASTISCSKKSEGGTTEMISGTDSKIWKAKKETNSEGDKEKLSSEEKQEQIQFFANGNFTQTSNAQSANGTWAYDAANKNLSLTYQNNNVSENFKVNELTKNDMTLQAPDGSALVLEAQ